MDFLLLSQLHRLVEPWSSRDHHTSVACAVQYPEKHSRSTQYFKMTVPQQLLCDFSGQLLVAHSSSQDSFQFERRSICFSSRRTNGTLSATSLKETSLKEKDTTKKKEADRRSRDRTSSTVSDFYTALAAS